MRSALSNRRQGNYVDYQARASVFSPGDRVYPVLGGNPAAGGTVVAVFPAIGMVDVQFSYGAARYPVEDLAIDTSEHLENFQDFQADSVPGGTPTVSVPGGPDKLQKDVREELTDDALYRDAAVPRRWGKDELEEPRPKGHYVSVFQGPEPREDRTDWSKQLWAFGPFRYEKEAEAAEAKMQDRLGPGEFTSVTAVIPPAKKADVDRVVEAYVKKALYWDSPDRKYRMSRGELDSGCPSCPRCPGVELRKVIYKREDGKNERLYACGDCLFMIRRDDIIGMEGT